MQNIAGLMHPAIPHDLGWLRNALQAAVELEFSTIPPYLCAQWSIQDDGSDVGDAVTSRIERIVMQEMYHMGLACNMLAAIGGTPRIAGSDFIPVYPGELPGGVIPGLIVPLRPLSQESLRVFMEIEKPEHPIPQPLNVDFLTPIDLGQTFPTIGAFYDAINEAFGNLTTTIGGGLQVTMNVRGDMVKPIQSLTDAQTALERIKQQGEGTAQTVLAGDVQVTDVAHFYTFREIATGHAVNGEVIHFPNVFDFPPVPKEGNPESAPFDATFSDMLRTLESAWTVNPSKAVLSRSKMAVMKIAGIALIKTGKGPDFRYIP